MQELPNQAIADQVRNDKNVNCHTALDAVPQGFGVEEFSSLEVEKKYRHCERMRSNPGKHQASSCTYKPKYIYPLSYRTRCGIARYNEFINKNTRNELFNPSTFQPLNSPPSPVIAGRGIYPVSNDRFSVGLVTPTYYSSIAKWY